MPQAPVRFMIACAARTGSTMLVRTLRSHPGVVMLGEVWDDAMVGLDGPLARECEADPAAFATHPSMQLAYEDLAGDPAHRAHPARRAGAQLRRTAGGARSSGRNRHGLSRCVSASRRPAVDRD